MNPTAKQTEEVTKMESKEYHIYLADQQQYVKILEDMENAVLMKKEPFPKSISDVCWQIIGWRNNYGGWSICNEANDVVEQQRRA